MKFHHIGIATADMDAARTFIERLWDISSAIGPVYDELRNVDLMLLKDRRDFFIELVSGPMVEPFIRRRQFLYHSCYEVHEIDAAIDQSVEAGAIVIVKPAPAVLFEGRKVAFVNTPVGIVEFLESAK